MISCRIQLLVHAWARTMFWGQIILSIEWTSHQYWADVSSSTIFPVPPTQHIWTKDSECTRAPGNLIMWQSQWEVSKCSEICLTLKQCGFSIGVVPHMLTARSHTPFSTNAWISFQKLLCILYQAAEGCIKLESSLDFEKHQILILVPITSQFTEFGLK